MVEEDAGGQAAAGLGSETTSADIWRRAGGSSELAAAKKQTFLLGRKTARASGSEPSFSAEPLTAAPSRHRCPGPTSRAGVAILLVIAGFLPTSAKSDDLANQGGGIAKQLCSGCHAIAGPGPSPVAAAPIFSTIGRRIEIGDLAEALAEGILTGHGPTEMPEFILTPDEIDALLAYLHSVQK